MYIQNTRDESGEGTLKSWHEAENSRGVSPTPTAQIPEEEKLKELSEIYWRHIKKENNNKKKENKKCK